MEIPATATASDAAASAASAVSEELDHFGDGASFSILPNTPNLIDSSSSVAADDDCSRRSQKAIDTYESEGSSRPMTSSQERDSTTTSLSGPDISPLIDNPTVSLVIESRAAEVHFSSKVSIKPPNIIASDEDLPYLETQGCLRVPNNLIMDEFLRQYFLCIHPMLPFLNEGDFWDIYLEKGSAHTSEGEKQVSLLLLQAMMFASCNVIMDPLPPKKYELRS